MPLDTHQAHFNIYHPKTGTVRSMYLIVIAWLYVTVMMGIAEATSPQGTLLGALITFLLYGLLPMGLLVYILGTPERKRQLKARQLAEQEAWQQANNQAASTLPDTSSHTPRAAQQSGIAAVREEL